MAEFNKRRVYYFVKAKYGLLNLENRRLKISTILGLNDPFELLSNNVRNRVVRKLFNQAKSNFDKHYGILCFSNSSLSPVQWAHYADRHTGICLGFDVRADLLVDIQYIAERISEASFPTHPDSWSEWMLRILSAKYSHWAYEEEARCFLRLKSKVDGKYYREFDSDMSLAEVQVGFNSKISRSQLAGALGDLSGSVTCFKVRPSFGKFEMIRNENDSLWK